jgi:hypothetical protein
MPKMAFAGLPLPKGSIGLVDYCIIAGKAKLIGQIKVSGALFLELHREIWDFFGTACGLVVASWPEV